MASKPLKKIIAKFFSKGKHGKIIKDTVKANLVILSSKELKEERCEAYEYVA